MPNLVQFLQANQRVFIRRILMIKLMLHETGEPSELWHVLSQEAHFVHGSEHRSNVAALVQNLEKSLVDVMIGQEGSIYQ